MNKKQSTPTSEKQDKATAEVLKLGIDIHKSRYVVVCQSDGEAPKAPQSFPIRAPHLARAVPALRSEAIPMAA